MTTTSSTSRSGAGRLAVFFSLSAAACAMVTGCKSTGSTAGAGSGVARPVMLDGSLDEWPTDYAVTADQDYYYFRVGLEEPVTLQAATHSLALWLDADGSGATGKPPSAPRDAASMGVDLEVQFSPPGGEGGATKRGVECRAWDAGGVATAVPHADLDLAFQPTYASNAFEVRLSRHPAGNETLARLLAARGTARAMFVQFDADGKPIAWSDPESVKAPAARSSRPLSEEIAPAKPDGAVRVLVWNVHDSGPSGNAPPFARVMEVLAPDIVLAQEWYDADEATLEAWFTAVVTGENRWHARTGAGRGVAIVSRYPIEPLGPDKLTVEGAGSDEAIRFIAGRIATPAGEIAAASVHLKCCGTMDSAEDRLRLAQADVINAAMHSALSGGEVPVPFRIIAGDFNLVGSRPPLDRLRAGLDSDGADLAVAEPGVVGDATRCTWSDPASPFSDGRLDYAVYGPAGLSVANAFVLDTSRLSDAALARLGLDRTDTAASDHLPIVVDIIPR